MNCTCPFDRYYEHERSCPEFEPPLTQAEIRELRVLLSEIGDTRRL